MSTRKMQFSDDLDDEERASERHGLFRDYHISTLNKLEDAHLSQLGALKSDLERLSFCYKLDYVHDMNVIRDYRAKCAAKAKQMRMLGNEAFRKQDWKQALKMYSGAVINAPAGNNDGEPELALALANRSAVLVHLKEHQAALDDIEDSLSCNYPIELHFKLTERQAKCLLSLQRRQEAVKACLLTKEKVALSKLSPRKQEAILKDVEILSKEAMLCLFSAAPSSGGAEVKPGLPDLCAGSNPDYRNASKRVQIVNTVEAGRFAVASDRIDAGDVLVVERPYASVMQPEKYSTHCHHCYRVINVAPGPCQTCSRIAFCTRSCRDRACRSYHAYECPIIDMLYKAGISITCYLALRMITVHKPQFFLDLKPVLTNHKLRNKVLNEHPKQRQLTNDQETYLKIYDLVSHAEHRNVESFFHLNLMARFLLQCLRVAGYFDPPARADSSELTDDELWTGSLLLRHIQSLQFNAHEVSELQMKSCDSVDGAKAVFLGAAVYPTLSLFNHSCEPGITRYFVGDIVIVRAIKGIEKGDMIAENYGPIFTIKVREARKRILKERYWFDCCCRPCSEDWPIYTQIDDGALKFRCTTAKCRKPLQVSTDTESPFVLCSHCKKSINILKGLQILAETEIPFTNAITVMGQGKFSAALAAFTLILRKLDDVLCPPFHDYHMCQEAARKCMLALGNTNVVAIKK